MRDSGGQLCDGRISGAAEFPVYRAEPRAELCIGCAERRHLHDADFQPAVMQQGRKIVIDVEQAVELFKTHKDGDN